MLCNDSDLHLASADSSQLLELGQQNQLNGIKVYDSGRLIEAEKIKSLSLI
jgi:hypothetical protein